MFDDRYYMAFEWLDGMSIFPPDITLENCIKIGTLLGKIHSADVMIPDIQKESIDTMSYDWDKYLLSGWKTGAEWTEELLQVIDDLKKWNSKSNEACVLLNSSLVLSHRDMDPKNIMWKDDEPYIIDWEAAGYINPYQELLEVLNYWSDNGEGKLDKDKFAVLYNAYIKIVGSFKVSWDTVFAGGFEGMLGWLNYNFKRSLGIECSSTKEKNLGTEQVFDTIKALKQYSQRTELLRNWLNE
jgi:thiamine kinase-like enzyme